VEDFALCVTAIVNQLRALGEKMTEKEEIKKLHHSVIENLEQVAISIETLLDLNSMSIEEATRHLHAVDERKKKTSSQGKDGRLLLTEEEWLTRLKVRDGEGVASSGGHGCGRGRCGSDRSGDGRGSQADSQEENPCRPKATDVCRAYGKLGQGVQVLEQEGGPGPSN
jgi:hypothetical protein